MKRGNLFVAVIGMIMATLFSSAQPVRFTYVSPGPMCPGDTLNIWFKFDGTPGGYQFNMVSSKIQIWQISSPQFYSLPRSFVNGDTIYLIKFKTPIWWPLEITQVSPNFINNWTVVFQCATGIMERRWDELEGPSVYYDLMGNVTEARRGEILIERKGNRVRKVIIN